MPNVFKPCASLKPCPLCLSEVYLIQKGDGARKPWVIQCMQCRCVFQTHRADYAPSWNARAQDPASFAAGRLAGLEEAARIGPEEEQK